MLSITEEYECCNFKSKSGKKDDNTAFYSNDAEKGQKKVPVPRGKENVITVERKDIGQGIVGKKAVEKKGKALSRRERRTKTKTKRRARVKLRKRLQL